MQHSWHAYALVRLMSDKGRGIGCSAFGRVSRSLHWVLRRAALHRMLCNSNRVDPPHISGAMTQSDTFLDVVCGALNAAGRRAAVVRVAGAGPDHVLDPFYPEGRYLTNVTLVLP